MIGIVRTWMLPAAAVLGTAAWAGAQIRMPSPPPPYDYYGVVEPIEIPSLLAGSYQRRPVRTRGFITPLDIAGRYYELNDSGSVVLIPTVEIAEGLRTLIGRRVEVVGLVRELVTNQGTCPYSDGRMVPQSVCDFPDLPPTPDLKGDQVGWPKWSITAWSISDITPLEKRRGPVEAASLAEALAATAPADKPIRVQGRFCGANLCGGLGAAPVASAWALQADDAAVWVVGKEPQGKGWRLDPSYKGDTSRWLEVVGKIEPCGSARCLRARSVALIPRPETSPSP